MSILLLTGYCILIIIFLAALILLLPINKCEPLNIPGTINRIDEREAIFHRFYRLIPGSSEFKTYYRAHPEKLEHDRRLREMPDLAEPGTSFFSSLSSPYPLSVFDLIEKINQNLDAQENVKTVKPVHVEATNMTNRIKGFARYLGADCIGMTRLNPKFIYSHIGRSPGQWGAPVDLDHPYAVVLAVEMNHQMTGTAPELPALTETAVRYLNVTGIAVILSRYIQRLGYKARAHVDGNYRVLCVPVAVDAGLGELGRHGLLITPQFGSRVRLAVVTTDMPLIPDSPVSFGVQDFCSICRKCADFCPSNAINSQKKQVVNGVEKWQTDQEACYSQWRHFGTDCGICIRVCPYSHPNSPFHNTIRRIIRRNMLARRLAFYLDSFFYSRNSSSRIESFGWHGKDQ